MSNPHVNNDYRLAIQSVLKKLDQMLCQFERWALKKAEHQTFFAELNRLTGEQCNFILQDIKAIRSLFTELSDRLGLRKDAEEVSESIHAMTILYITDTLMAVKEKNSDIYGRVDPDSFTYIEPILNEIMATLFHICRVAKG